LIYLKANQNKPNRYFFYLIITMMTFIFQSRTNSHHKHPHVVFKIFSLVCRIIWRIGHTYCNCINTI